MRKLSLLSRMRTCGRRRPLRPSQDRSLAMPPSGFSCGRTPRLRLPRTAVCDPPARTLHRPWMQRRGWLLRQPPRWLRVALAY